MHPAALEWLTTVSGHVLDNLDWGPDTGAPVGLDVGGGGVLGSKARHLFDPVRWSTVDWNPYGPVEWQTDVVADLTVLKLPDQLPAQGYGVVLCTEVLEHVPAWPQLVTNCVRLVGPGGHLVLTCAGPDREPHSMVDGGPLRAGEYYGNVDPNRLADYLLPLTQPYGLAWRQFVVNVEAHDIYLHLQAQARAHDPNLDRLSPLESAWYDTLAHMED